MEKQNRNVSFTPFTDNLKETSAIVDKEMENSLKELGLLKKTHLFGLVKRRGFGLCQILLSILIWPLLNAGSLNFVGVSEFLDRALQLDERYLHSELKAEKIGAFQG